LKKVLSAERIARALGAATCQVLKGGIIHLDSVGGAIAFQKIRDKKGKLVDTLAFTNEDEIALDYKLIQDTYGADCYNIYSFEVKMLINWIFIYLIFSLST